MKDFKRAAIAALGILVLIGAGIGLIAIGIDRVGGRAFPRPAVHASGRRLRLRGGRGPAFQSGEVGGLNSCFAQAGDFQGPSIATVIP
ncbi:MAG: hypothetical protein GY741_15405 [Phycisphaeraceae bacterium]|nr:hypothetical protein [Phycisphaeraceae bacterium]